VITKRRPDRSVPSSTSLVVVSRPNGLIVPSSVDGAEMLRPLQEGPAG
jgi:hypothetical protein